MKNNFLLIFFLFTFKTIGDDCDCCNCLNFCENEENDTLDNKKNILDEKKDNKNDILNEENDNKNDILNEENNNKNDTLDEKKDILNKEKDILNKENDIPDKENNILNEENNILDNEYLSYFKFEEYKNNPEVSEEIENDTIDIFLCIDDAFVYPCLVTIKSIIDNSENKNLLSFFILIPEKFNSSEYIEKFKEKEKCKIQIISMGDKYEKLSTGRRWATPTYYRFSIPWITKKKKAIYLDSDLLIRKDIKNLFDIDLEGYCYAAVVDGSANEKHILPNLKGNITIEKGNYYNSGVLLLNCDKIRKEMPATFANLLLKHQKEKDSYRFLDQDILNIACHNKIKKLPPKYNFVLNSYYGGMLGVYEETGKIYTENKKEFEFAQKDATIVHFIRPKPWEGEYNSIKTKEGDENFEDWLKFFNLWGLSTKLNITEDLLDTQKTNIVEKYYKEWKEVAAKVAKSVYE